MESDSPEGFLDFDEDWGDEASSTLSQTFFDSRHIERDDIEAEYMT